MPEGGRAGDAADDRQRRGQTTRTGPGSETRKGPGAATRSRGDGDGGGHKDASNVRGRERFSPHVPPNGWGANAIGGGVGAMIGAREEDLRRREWLGCGGEGRGGGP